MGQTPAQKAAKEIRSQVPKQRRRGTARTAKVEHRAPIDWSRELAAAERETAHNKALIDAGETFAAGVRRGRAGGHTDGGKLA